MNNKSKSFIDYDYLLRIYYSDKVINKSPYLYRLTITEVDKLIKFSKKLFKPDYQKYFNSVINIIDLIHKSKIRNKIQKHPNIQILEYFMKTLETNFKVEFGDENNEIVKSINFHTSNEFDIIINNSCCYNSKDNKYIKIFFNHSKDNAYTIASKFYYNGNLKILVFFKNKDIISPDYK